MMYPPWTSSPAQGHRTRNPKSQTPIPAMKDGVPTLGQQASPPKPETLKPKRSQNTPKPSMKDDVPTLGQQSKPKTAGPETLNLKSLKLHSAHPQTGNGI